MFGLGISLYTGEDIEHIGDNNEFKKSYDNTKYEVKTNEPIDISELPHNMNCDKCGSKKNLGKDGKPPYCYTCWKNKQNN